MEKGKMIANDNHGSSTDPKIKELDMMGITELDLKRGRDDPNINMVDGDLPKRTRYHRHSAQQIHEMEKLFQECPHPSDKQRRELSQALGMEPTQIKFWFQNKRNHLKTQREHVENIKLRTMNNKLRADNAQYKDVLCNALCTCCGGPYGTRKMSPEELQLKMENDILRKEIGHISTLATKYSGRF